MATTAEAVSRWARTFVAGSVLFLLAWQAGHLIGIGRRLTVILGLYGFVFHTVFGKAYSLLPSYFDREFAVTWVPPLHFGLTVIGVVLLSAGVLGVGPASTAAIGAALWASGVGVFLGGIGWTIRDNLSGRETGTSDANADRRPIDRTSNAAVPIVLVYLAVGAYDTLAWHAGLPGLVGGGPARTTHILAAGAVALLVFAVGFRLLPRFLVATPPRPLVGVVLVAGAIGPALIAGSLNEGWAFRVGAVLEGIAVIGFATTYLVLFRRTDRDRIGFYGVLAGVTAGVLGVLFGLWFAFVGRRPELVTAHLRLNLLGFLGLTIVGVTYQFYPPAVGDRPAVSDRTALVSIGLLAGGLLLEVAGLVGGAAPVIALGRAGGVAGAALHAWIVLGLFRDRYR